MKYKTTACSCESKLDITKTYCIAGMYFELLHFLCLEGIIIKQNVDQTKSYLVSTSNRNSKQKIFLTLSQKDIKDININTEPLYPKYINNDPPPHIKE